MFSLQQMLGHTTLEMTRKYTDMVALEKAVKKRRLSQMDATAVARTSYGRERQKGAPERSWEARQSPMKLRGLAFTSLLNYSSTIIHQRTRKSLHRQARLFSWDGRAYRFPGF